MARPYGREADRETVRPAEAAAIREVVRKMLDEDEPVTLKRAAAWLNESGHLTATGRPWEVGTLKRTITSPLIAGLKTDPDGQLIHDGIEPIISADDREALLARLSRRPVAKQEPYLLTGIAHCGHCGQLLTASRSYRPGAAGQPRKASRAYVCPPPNALNEQRRGCGRIRALAEPVEDHVGAAVLGRLIAPESAAAVAAAIRAEEDRAAKLRQDIAGAKQKLSELASEWAYGGTPSTAIRPIRDSLQRQVRDGERALRQIALLSDTPVHDQAYLTQVTPTRQAAGGSVDAETLAGWWENASVTRRRALVALLVKRVTVGPVRRRGARSFDPERVKIDWR